MNKKDVAELKKRLKKDDCTFTKMSGCYVNGEKNIVKRFTETFLNLDDDEFFKYLEIARKTLSGTVGNNLLQLEFPTAGGQMGEAQKSLIALNKSGLKDEGMLDSFYQMIIDHYDYAGNFLILLFHDAYDVIKKTSDGSKLDESEEVYEYTICAICPVTLSKATLGYIEDINRIGAVARQWIVNAPNLGFVFPAFSDRSSDVNSIMYYTKNAKDTHPELMEEVLGCPSKKTATEQKELLKNIVDNAIGFNEEKSAEIFSEIQENLNSQIEQHESINGDAPLIVTKDTIKNILEDSNVEKDIALQIEKDYAKEFTEDPAADNLIDNKVLKENEKNKELKSLRKKVKKLENEVANEDIGDFDVVVKVNPDKVNKIESKVVEGEKYLTIPLDEKDRTNINGLDFV